MINDFLNFPFYDIFQIAHIGMNLAYICTMFKCFPFIIINRIKGIFKMCRQQRLATVMGNREAADNIVGCSIENGDVV